MRVRNTTAPSYCGHRAESKGAPNLTLARRRRREDSDHDQMACGQPPSLLPF